MKEFKSIKDAERARLLPDMRAFQLPIRRVHRSPGHKSGSDSRIDATTNNGPRTGNALDKVAAVIAATEEMSVPPMVPKIPVKAPSERSMS